MPRFLIKDTRFYIYTQGADPRLRAAPNPEFLVFLAHGHIGATETVEAQVTVHNVFFGCAEGRTVEPDDDLERALAALAPGQAPPNYFSRHPAPYLSSIPDYRIRKEVNPEWTKKQRKKVRADNPGGTPDFIDHVYIADQFNAANYDVLSLHNKFFGSREVRMSDVFACVGTKLANKYNYLLCINCRERAW
jgi:hypothetical protein